MNHKVIALILSVLLPMAAGCMKKSAPGAAREATKAMYLSLSEPVAFAQSQRFIAERHKLEVVTSETQLQKSWESVISFCGTIRCEVISSTITAKTGALDPSGSVALRVAPEDLPKLLGAVEKAGKVAVHTTEREDKTTQVVDTEAKIKNLTAFRDNLRSMMARPSATVKDLVEIQKQLTDTQSELDSETAQRKILANETEKVAVTIDFRVDRAGKGTGAFSDVWDALSDSAAVLAESTAALITVIVAVIPWLILIVPAIWFLRKVWKGYRRKRAGVAATTSAQ